MNNVTGAASGRPSVTASLVCFVLRRLWWVLATVRSSPAGLGAGRLHTVHPAAGAPGVPDRWGTLVALALFSLLALAMAGLLAWTSPARKPAHTGGLVG